MTLKIRPFTRQVGASGRNPACSVSGCLDGETFVLCMEGANLDGARFALPTSDIGIDGRGPFGLIDEDELPIGEDWVLRISAEYDEPVDETDVAQGCRIAVEKRPDRKMYEAAARRRGANLSKVHLVIPIESGLSVYFDASGRCDGVGYFL